MLISEKLPKQKKIRHAEYYDLIPTFDRLYDESKNNKVFDNLMSIIISEGNILLAYRNIKRNKGSVTPGVDKISIKDIEKLSQDKLISIIRKKLTWYEPKPVKRKEIPKPNGKMRPLGIPTMIDRIVQQCILQVLDPICEAKFYNRSNGFRPNRSAENAIAQFSLLANRSKLHYVVDVDICGFFDNVNHSKLIQQIWDIGIRDKKLLCIIKAMLKAPIVMSDGSKVYPTKGTPQGGVLSPLLSNIVLNELDWWIASQWDTMPTKYPYKVGINKNGAEIKSDIYSALKTSKLKEVFIVRYADDFRLFCRNRNDANKMFLATKLWLEDRLKLQINMEKSKIVNIKKGYSEFLGFRLRVHEKGSKYVIKSSMLPKARINETQKLKNQIMKIQNPDNLKEEYVAINRYNSMVIGIHNYYQIATDISLDCSIMAFQLNKILKNRLGDRLSKTGNINKQRYVRLKYGKSQQMRYVHDNPIAPIGYIKTRYPVWPKRDTCKYTPKGREIIHKGLKLDLSILHLLMRNISTTNSVEYMDNRISLYVAQQGKCAITGRILSYDEIRCHHKKPKKSGGTDEYSNLVILHENVHILLHATTKETIAKYLQLFKLDNTMLKKLNKLREMLTLELIEN